MIRVITATTEYVEAVKEYLVATGGMGGVDIKHHVLSIALDEHEHIVGIIASQPVALFHEFRVSGDMRRRQIAESLYHYAIGSARAAGYVEGIMLIDKRNDAMLRFISEARGKLYGEPDSNVVYLLPIR